MLKSDYLSKRSEGLDIDQSSPALIMELLETESEWLNIQEIVRLTFKGVYHVLSAQRQMIQEIEQALPAKANKQDVAQQLSSKANLSDIKKTMAEVAANIESRITYDDVKRMLEDKVPKQEVHYLLQSKVQFEDMKHYVDQALSALPLEDELHALRLQIEDGLRDKKPSQSSASDLQQFRFFVEGKLAEVDDKLNEKANKQSVAQALHRKANRPDIDAILAKKADLSDLQRIISAVEHKIDVVSFEQLVRAVEQKADRHELAHSFRREEKSTDIEKSHQLNQDMERRMLDIERQNAVFSREVNSEVDQVRSHVQMALGQKVDFRDLEALTHKLHGKADVEKVQELMGQIRSEVLGQLTTIRKDVAGKGRKKDDEQKKKKQEEVFALEKAFEEIKIMKDKMQKLATQFDKELAERDKQLKQFQSLSQGDFTKGLASLHAELELVRKQAQEVEVRKVDKRELTETKAKIMAALDTKAETVEVQSRGTSAAQDQAQRHLELRSELFKKISDIQTLVQATMQKKIGTDEFNEALSQKVDFSMLRSGLEQKANVVELDNQKRLIERVLKELELKASTREVEGHLLFTKNAIEELSREMVLKASIKDICMLLDQKANVEDVNSTLALVQKEVEKSVTDEDLRKALDGQALVNEALCAQNCVGRWIWKSGELKNQNQVPWEVQALNTCPDNFLWDKSKQSVITVAPGLYEISFGFYSKKQPQVQLHLNGEPLMSVAKSQHVQDTGKENRVTTLGKHSAGNVTGLTLLDFVALPARARLSLTYSGEAHGEGFFNVRKL